MTQAVRMVMPNGVHTFESPQRQKALRLLDAHNQRMADINANADLNPEAKARHIATSWATTKRDLAALQAEEQNSFAQRKTDLERNLFGHYASGNSGPDRIIAVRDAEDRASQLQSDDEAQALFERASRNGDAMLAKSVAAAAINNGWQNTAGAYLKANPTAEKYLEEINAIERQQTDPAALLGAAMAYAVPTPSVPRPALAEAANEAGVRL